MFHGLFDPPLASGWEKDFIGYLAGALVVCTFSFRSMHLLRYAGIASNVSFMAYAVLAGTTPILVLHSLLLPINVFRLIQIERTRPAVNLDMRHMVSSTHSERPSRRDGSLLDWLRGCFRRFRERSELQHLDYRDRHDIGFSRILDETSKRFWQN